jgi:hypothetical protein
MLHLSHGIWVLAVACCTLHVRASLLHSAADRFGKAAFTHLQSVHQHNEAAADSELQSLYSVNVNFDIEALETASGVTMKFDKVNHALRLDAGISPAAGLAWGRYKDSINSSGWSELWLDTTSNQAVSNDVRMYAAGYIEGLVTCVRLSEHQYNVHRLLVRTEATKHALANVKSVLSKQIAFMKQKANLVPHIMAKEPEEPYWKQSRYILFQLWGLVDGYNFAAKHFGTNKLALEDLLILNMGAELAELLEAYTPQAAEKRTASQDFVGTAFLQRNRKQSFGSGGSRGEKNARITGIGNASEDFLDDAHWESRVMKTGHCSALIKVTPDNDDIFIGHTTWDDYSKMTRIFKYYNFHLDGASTMAKKISFSSYPGAVSSTDDFFIMSSGLTVMDTSIEILDPAIYSKVLDFPGHAHIPNFAHLMITNRLAKNGAHWTQLFSTQNTGTSVSQWMIVDYNSFKTGRPVPDGTFWLLEAVPGLVQSADMSHHLRETSYWPSFNRPFFDDVRDVTGHASAEKSHGAMYSWKNNPRATIFDSMQGGIRSLAAMRETMTHNHAPLTANIPGKLGHEISARMDLDSSLPIPNGGIDAKIVDRCLFTKMQVQAISSPTHVAVPAFQWQNSDGAELFQGYPHAGLPNLWNFGWVQMTSSGVASVSDSMVC